MKVKFNSYILTILIALFILISHYYIRTVNYSNWNNVLGWDVLAYYLYLPFTFIYDDPGISNLETIQHIFDTYHPSGTFYQGFRLENGNHSPMYTMGMAIFYAPFFFIAHIWASISDYPADGFSFPYQYLIANGVMVYIVFGLFMVRKVLKRFFDEKVTMITMALMLLGTTFFHETLADEVGPHAISFACFATIMWLIIKWHDELKLKWAFLLGVVAGLAVLARGSGIVIGIIPVLWGVYNKDSLLNKVELVKNNWKQIVGGILGLSVFPLTQMIYWKAITGTFVFNTYKVTPGFDWLEPHFLKVFFSYKKGWFLYTPMIAFVFIGVTMLWKKNKNIALGIIIFFVLNVYFISSWGTWWQGGSFGNRYFVESYAVLVLPLGYFVQWVLANKVLKYVFYPVAGFFLFLNLFQTWQFNNWIFDGYSMTKEYYWRVFLKTEVPEGAAKYKEIHRTFDNKEIFENPGDYHKKTVGILDFENYNSIPFESHGLAEDTFASPPYCYKITKDHIYGPTFKLPWFKLTDNEHMWIKVSFNYLAYHDLKESPASLVIELDHNEGQYTEKYKSYDLERLDTKIGQWNHAEFDYLTPYPLSEKNDVIKIFPYIRGDKPLYVDDIHIEVFERKW